MNAANAVMVLVGFGSGILVAAGVVALLVGLGIITRFAGLSRTAAYNRGYEAAVLFGAVFGNLLTVYQINVPLGRIGLAVFGISAGMYVGGWIMALAEVVNVFPVFSRRIGLTKGTCTMVCCLAVGKTIGSMLYFFMRW